MLLDVLDQKLVATDNRTLSSALREKTQASNEPTGEPQVSLLSADDELLARPARQPRMRQSAGPSQSNLSSQASNLDFNDRHIKFTLDLMQSIFASQAYGPKTNLLESFLISPLSIQTVLMMMHLGARGQTRRELSNCLYLIGSAPQFESANQEVASSAQASLSFSSLSKLKRRHQSGVTALDKQQPQSGSALGKIPQLSSLSTPPPAATTNSPPAAAATTTTAASPTTSTSAAATTRHPALGQQQPSLAAHELFGSAMRNLLKDPAVMKALTSATQVFLQKNLPLSSQYEWAIKNYYQADVKLVDFQHQESLNFSSTSPASTNVTQPQSAIARDEGQPSLANNNNIQQMINEWIEKQTKGRISNLLTSPVPTSTLMMAINALFFKGDWQFKFDPSDTETDALFTHADGKTSKVPMMVNKLPLAFAHDPSMRTSVIELPYKAQRLGLFLLLPDEVSGIFHTMQMLNSTSFMNLISSMRKPTTFSANQPPNAVDPASSGINVRIPKFSIESSPRMSQILSQQLGLKTLFSPDVADLSGMFSSGTSRKSRAITSSQSVNTSTGKVSANQQVLPTTETLQVGLDELLHKAVLQVDEQGSTAAASSATIVERVGLFNSNYFEADHPFLLFLMDKQTGLVLFSGVFAGNSNNDSTSSNNNYKQQQQSFLDRKLHQL